METISANLPTDLDEIEIVVFADEHMGDPLSDVERVKKRIEYVKDHKNVYCILNGDLVDNATRTSIGDVFIQDFNPMQQLETAVEMFSPITHKILAITHGNHENRSYKDTGLNMSKLIAIQLGLEDKYCTEGVLLFVRFGKKRHSGGNGDGRACYTIYTTHGRGGGRKEGAKAIRLADMASIVDADVYIHSHTHLPMIMKQGFYRTSYANQSVSFITKLFVNTSANLEYGGYGQVGEFKPNSTDDPIIYLNAKDHKAEAKM